MERINPGPGAVVPGQGTEAFLRAFLALVPRKDQDLIRLLASHRNSRIWVFGAAGIGISVKRWLAEQDFCVYSFCDNDPEKVGTLVDGTPVRSFSELCRDRNKIVLIAIWKYFEEIVRQCEGAGVQFWDATLLSGVVFDTVEESCKFISKSLPQLDSVCQELADDRSAEIYKASLVSRIFRERSAMKRYRSPVQYIEPEIAPLGKQETVFICGAGNGAAAIEVDKATMGTAEMHLFEPDGANCTHLRNAVSHMPNARCIESGVGRRSERLSFCGGMGENATFSIPGNQIATLVAIDNYVADVGVVPTYITMDIEGWEMEALHGAAKTISRYKPKLAISLYHRATDFVNVPRFILGLRPDYDIYVRHYTDSYSDTIAYFV